MKPLKKTKIAPQTSILIDAQVQLNSIIVGKEDKIRLALVCLLSGGHLLLEDVPGVGKTTLAHALAKTLGFSHQRVQFTNDMLPSDLLGVSIYDKTGGQFVFHKGPVFTQLLLADEINRATPKSQSALLEAMAEQQVTVDGKTYPLPSPFCVIGTQNPLTQSGTFPLPESQLDRFLMRISMGYPSPEDERGLLIGENRKDLLNSLNTVMSHDEFIQIQQSVESIHVSDSALDYLQELIKATRAIDRFQCGLSPRAAIGLLGAARCWALVDGREYLLPDDIQAVFFAVAGHRLTSAKPGHATGNHELQAIIDDIPLHP